MNSHRSSFLTLAVVALFASACALPSAAQTATSPLGAAAGTAASAPTFIFRTIVPAPASGASVAELGQATAAGLGKACLKEGQEMVAVLHAPDSLAPDTGIYAVSATVGLLPQMQGPLLWPEESYVVTRALPGLSPEARKKMALETVQAAAGALCRSIANQAAGGEKKP